MKSNDNIDLLYELAHGVGRPTNLWWLARTAQQRSIIALAGINGIRSLPAGRVRTSSIGYAGGLRDGVYRVQVEVSAAGTINKLNTNTKYTCDTGQTRNKLLEQWVHLTNHTAGHSITAAQSPSASLARVGVYPMYNARVVRRQHSIRVFGIWYFREEASTPCRVCAVSCVCARRRQHGICLR